MNAFMKHPVKHPILIVGGGLIGVTTLYELTMCGRAAILLEAESELACGASFANGGVLHPSQPAPWNAPGIGWELLRGLFLPTAPIKIHPTQLPHLFFWGLQFLRYATRHHHNQAARDNFKLAHLSTQATIALSDALDLNYDNRATGMMQIFRTSHSLDKAVRQAEKLAAHGLRYKILDTDAIRAADPQLDATACAAAGALHFEGDYIGDAHQFIKQLAAQATREGGQIRLNTKVTGLLVNNGRAIGVQTDDGSLTGEVVLACGHAMQPLTAGHFRLPIQPAKGYSVTLDAIHCATDLPTCPVVDVSSHIAVTPLGQKLRVLGMAEFIGQDTRIDLRRLAILKQATHRLYPRLASQLDWHAAINWAGLRPMSVDGRPLIGPSPIDGLWLNGGHGHLGWTMAYGSAQILCNQMLGHPRLNFDVAPFLPSRLL